MTISRVNGPGWSVGDKLTSTQANGLDLNGTYALDKRAAQTDTLQSIVSCSGAGRVVDTYAAGANADTTYLLSGANSLINASAISANRTYRLSNTGAVAGDRVMVLNASNFVLTVQNDTPTTIAQLGPDVAGGNDSTWADFVYSGSAWLLWRSSKPAAIAAATFTANGTWTCPRSVTLALLVGWGAGGGGGGGGSSNTTTARAASGGGGGGSALPASVVVAVSAGTGYTVTIGTAGTSGPSDTAGGAGSPTAFGSLALFLGACGGRGGVASSALSTFEPYAPGGTTPNPGQTPNAPTTGLVAAMTTVVPAGCGGAGIWTAYGLYTGYLGTGGGVPSGGYGGYNGGTPLASGSYNGGGGGGGGGGGNGFGNNGVSGGNGGSANNGGVGGAGNAGTSPPANSGGGGSGGGGGGHGSVGGAAGGAGGAGAAGKLLIIPLR